MATFYKICPPELYDEKRGGRRADTLGFLQLINGSQIHFMHFDDFDEGSARGLEVNWVFIDQAEEIGEGVYLHIDSRIGRWDGAKVPEVFLEANPDWPLTPETGIPRVPGYMFLACNPENELHWIWRRYHHDSQEWKDKYRKTHRMITASALDNPTYDQETISQMLSRDKQFVDRYVHGKWGYSEGAIHYISPQSKLYLESNNPDPEKNYITPEIFQAFLRKAHLYRILDHGGISPTCCLWLAVKNQVHLVYREYYVGDQLISTHRENINRLSREEWYVKNLADPSIFNKTSERAGGKWRIADDYQDTRISDSKPIYWEPADNNEFVTRNRVSELLREDPKFVNPWTNIAGGPRIYFLMKSSDYEEGCYNTTIELAGQKRCLVGTVDGKAIYSEDRDESIPDHAYDVVRYLSGLHAVGSQPAIIKPRKGSFFEIRKQHLMDKLMRRAG